MRVYSMDAEPRVKAAEAPAEAVRPFSRMLPLPASAASQVCLFASSAAYSPVKKPAYHPGVLALVFVLVLDTGYVYRRAGWGSVSLLRMPALQRMFPLMD